MVGTGGAGFLDGFIRTSVALRQYDQKRQQDAAELELRKEDLALRRDLLKGQEASRKLQDQVHMLGIQQALEEHGRRLRDRQRFGQPDATTPPAPVLPTGEPEGLPLNTEIVPDLQPNGGPARLVVPGQQGTTTAATNPNKALFDTMAQQIGANNGIDPAVVRLYTSAVLPQETRNYDSQAVSSAGAQGLSQLMPGTAAAMGVTQPFNPVENIRGGLQYLQQLYTQYGGDVAKTLAAYNAGPGRVAQAGGVPNIRETQNYVRNGVAAFQGTTPAPAVTPDTLRLQGLEAERAGLERDLQALLTMQSQAQSKDFRERFGKQIDDKRAALQLKESQINTLRTREKEREPAFEKDFEAYFATSHNGQRPADALKQPGGPAVVQQAQEAFRQRKMDEDVQKAVLKEERTQPLALERARAAKAATPIDEATQKSIAANISIFNSINKIEAILREGTDLPENFVNLVSQNAPEIDAYLRDDKKALTGLLTQYKTTYGAAASNDPRINRFLSALGNMRDLVIAERSGSNVTGNELQRSTSAFIGSLPNVNQAFSLFAQNLANVKETVRDRLVNRGASVRELAGGDVLFEGLPTEVQLRILDQEKRAAARKPRPPQETRQLAVTDLTPEEVAAEIRMLEAQQAPGGR